MKEKILVFGSGGHAKVVIDIIEKENKFNIHAVVDKTAQKEQLFFGYTVIEETKALLQTCPRGIIAIGDNWARLKVSQKILTLCPQFEFVTVIHPSAQIAKQVTIGAGSMIVAGAIINSDTIIGQHCIINTGATLDHDCKMGDYSSLAPGVTIGGTVEIGAHSAIALGAKIVHSQKIGLHTVIGAGAVVVGPIDDNVFAMGVPCKVVRTREPGEKYL